MATLSINDRNNIIKKHLSLGLFYKVIGMGLSYISFPIILNYLGEENYGIWITIFSIMSWIYNFDVGIGNGLKNKLTEALALKNYKVAREYVSTAYVIIAFISFILFVLGSLGIYLVSFTNVLSINHLKENYLKVFVLVTFIFTLWNFVLGLYKQLFYSTHNSSIVSLTNIVYQAMVILFLLIFRNQYENSLLALAFGYGISSFITSIIFSFVFFKKYKKLIPKIKYYDTKKLKDIAGIGIEFFLIQLCMIIIFTTDNLIIVKFLGAEKVTEYSIVQKVYQIFIILFTIILNPFWSLYTDAYVRKDLNWIKRTLKKFNFIFIFLSISVVILSIYFEDLVGLWLKKDIHFNGLLIFLFALNVLIRQYGGIYMTFLNAIGEIKIQLYFYIFGALINIPLSIIFIKKFEMGISGVILGTNLSLISFCIIMPIQTYKILRRG